MAQADEVSTETVEVPAKGSKKKLMMIIIAVVLLIGGGAAAWILTQGKDASKSGESESSEAKAEAPAPAPKKATATPIFMTLETFTVNLVSDPGEQYLQTDISLQLTEASQEAVIKQFMPLVKAQILMVLSSKRSSEISDIDGKNTLSKEIVETVNNMLPGGAAAPAVSGVFFTSFIIQ